MFSCRLPVFASALWAAVASVVPTAFAQDAPAATIEEVLVTARRTQESQQDVPIALAAMSGDDLRREQINSPTDLNGKVPSLVVGTGSQMRNTETPTIRGQGAQFGSSPGVVIYLAEVALPSDPVANYQGGSGKFFDLSNIQVLKGSQGTLFGRNTTGGALLLEPSRPDNEFSLSLRAGISRMAGDNGHDPKGASYEAVVNLPLIDDVLMARIGGQVFERDGFTTDVVTGKDYDDKNYWTARLGVLWQPTERISNYLLVNFSDSDTNGTAAVIERVNRTGLNRAIPGALGLTLPSLPLVDPAQSANSGCLLLNAFGPSTNCGQDIIDEQAARGNRSVQLSGDPNDQLTSDTFVDNFSFDLTDSITLRNILSYSTLVHSYRWDLDGSRAAFNEFINPDGVNNSDVRTITEELQLQGEALEGALNYVVGAYYEETDADGRIIAKSLLFVDVEQGYKQHKESFAPFAQASYDLGHLTTSLAGLNLTLGVRYTDDLTEGSAFIKQVASGGFTLVDKSFVTEVETTALTYTAGLDYKFENLMLYGKVSRGYKTGGLSTIAANPQHYTYEPEFVVNYEIGQKADFALGDIPVRLNTALYYTDYTDMQTAAPDAYVDPDNPSPVPQLGQSIFNVGEATVAGLEMDLTVQLSPGLTVVATYGYTDAKYNRFDLDYFGATPQLDCSGQEKSRGDSLELTCLPFKTTPEHQYSLSLRYLLPVAQHWGDIEGSVTYAWVDEQYSAQISPPEAEPGAWLPDFGLVNASISWSRILDSAFSAQIYGTNLANKEYRISNSNQWNLTYFQSSIYSEPRNIGLQLSYDFGQ